MLLKVWRTSSNVHAPPQITSGSVRNTLTMLSGRAFIARCFRNPKDGSGGPADPYFVARLHFHTYKCSGVRMAHTIPTGLKLPHQTRYAITSSGRDMEGENCPRVCHVIHRRARQRPRGHCRRLYQQMRRRDQKRWMCRFR